MKSKEQVNKSELKGSLETRLETLSQLNQEDPAVVLEADSIRSFLSLPETEELNEYNEHGKLDMLRQVLRNHRRPMHLNDLGRAVFSTYGVELTDGWEKLIADTQVFYQDQTGKVGLVEQRARTTLFENTQAVVAA